MSTTRSFPNSLKRFFDTQFTRVNGSITGSAAIHQNLIWTDTVTHGNNIPGWRDKLRRGLSATTTLSGSKVVARYTSGSGRFEVKIPYPGSLPTSIQVVEVWGSLHCQSAIPSGDPSEISETKSNAEAMGKFLRKIREKQTAFQGGVFLGELAQTLSMIRNPAKGLRGLVDETRDILANIRRLGLKNSLSRSRVTEQLADAWLELQFGWKPLLNDVDDGCRALAILNTGQSLSTGRISAAHTHESNPTRTTVKYSQNGIALWNVLTDTRTRCTTVFRGALRVEARNPAELRRDLFGFNPNNFAPTIWNLIPYSFLIDYFTNVGDIIEGWSLLGTRLSWCNKTTIKSHVVSDLASTSFSYWDQENPNPDRSLASLAFSPAKVVIEKTRVQRAEYTQAMVPDLVFQVPGSGSLKWLNIAALIASRNGDRKWFYGD